MERLKLTEKAIGALTCPEGSKDRLVFDDAVPALGVRISSGGNKAFLAQYTTPSRPAPGATRALGLPHA